MTEQTNDPVLAQAAETKYHRLCGLNHRNPFLTVLENGNPRLRCWLMWFLVTTLFLAHRWPPFCCVFSLRSLASVCEHGDIFPSLLSFFLPFLLFSLFLPLSLLIKPLILFNPVGLGSYPNDLTHPSVQSLSCI